MLLSSLLLGDSSADIPRGPNCGGCLLRLLQCGMLWHRHVIIEAECIWRCRRGEFHAWIHDQEICIGNTTDTEM
jgi:hypothetical protein